MRHSLSEDGIILDIVSRMSGQKMPDQEVNNLIKKRDQLNAKIQQAKAKESAKKRKLETQAKILLGSSLLNRIQSNDEKADSIFKWCREALTDKDKERLDAVLNKSTEKNAASDTTNNQTSQNTE